MCGGVDRIRRSLIAAAANALGEVTQPQDVAQVIALLATGLARHATGTVIDVNAANFTR